MLRINLLATSRRGEPEKDSSSATLLVVAVLASFALTCTGLFVFHSSVANELETKQRANARGETEVRVVRSRIANHPRIREELALIRDRADAIAHLETARTGPTSMLVELSHLLSPGGRPSTDPAVLERVRRTSPSELYNPEWDPHRLWLTLFAEEARQVTMEGEGRTPADVGELMRRMMLSRYFADVRLERSEGAIDSETHLGVQRFKLVARVRY